VDDGDLLAQLRRLCQARPGPGALYLPARLSPEDAIQAVRLALKLLAGRQVVAPKPPRAGGRIQIQIDGAARGNPGPAGVGMVIIGRDGQVVERLHRFIGEATNNVAEYRALLLALERARALGVRDVEVSSDSELLVRQLHGSYQVKHPVLRGLYASARAEIAAFDRFTIQHVPRERNREADALANRAIDEAQRSVRRWVRSDPGAHGTGEEA
jgi:ribonuclease HI